MTTDQIVSAIDEIVSYLEWNKSLATADILNLIDSQLTKLEQSLDVQNIVTEIFKIDKDKMTKILEGVRKVLDLERKLTQTGLTDSIVSILTNAKNHTFILGLLVKWVL